MWASEALALTAQGAAALAGHDAGQLAAAGWVRLAGGVAGPAAWSTWPLPGAAGGWQSLLLVLAGPGAGQRRLYLRADRFLPQPAV